MRPSLSSFLVGPILVGPFLYRFNPYGIPVLGFLVLVPIACTKRMLA